MGSIRGLMVPVVMVLVFLVTTPTVAAQTSNTVRDAVCPTASTTASIKSATNLKDGATSPVTLASQSKYGTTIYAPGSLCVDGDGDAAAKPGGTTGSDGVPVWSDSQAESLVTATTPSGALKYAFPGAAALMLIVPLIWVAGGIGLAGLIGYRQIKGRM